MTPGQLIKKPDPTTHCNISSQSECGGSLSADGALIKWAERRKRSQKPEMAHKVCNPIQINEEAIE